MDSNIWFSDISICLKSGLSVSSEIQTSPVFGYTDSFRFSPLLWSQVSEIWTVCKQDNFLPMFKRRSSLVHLRGCVTLHLVFKHYSLNLLKIAFSFWHFPDLGRSDFRHQLYLSGFQTQNIESQN